MPLRLGQVPGAAGSGTKFAPSGTTERKADWTCPDCRNVNRGYVTRCLTTGCNAKRPTGHALRMAQVDATPFLPELSPSEETR